MSMLRTFINRLKTRLLPAIEACGKFNLRDSTFAKVSNHTGATSRRSSGSLRGLGRHGRDRPTAPRRNSVAVVVNDRKRCEVLIFSLIMIGLVTVG